jgi:CIC family chloride channel protein
MGYFPESWSNLVFAGTARVPIATLVMVGEMTGGYGLIIPSMLATIVAFVVQRTVGARSQYPRLYEAQVELRSDSSTHHESMFRAAFAGLERGPLADLRNVTFPHLASLLRYDTPIPIHGGHGELLTVHIGEHSQLADRSLPTSSSNFLSYLQSPLSGDEHVQLPRG